MLSVVAVVGGVLALVKGNKHAFSLDDPAISYPHSTETVSTGVLIAVSLVAPGVITAVASLLLVPGPTSQRGTPSSLVWRWKLWEWNSAWMGLGIALAGAFLATEGLKDLYGKPRPDLLDRCNPDLSKISDFKVGGLGLQLGNAPILVTAGICQNSGKVIDDGFASFPSGHSSFSWAGMLYLSLFLCSKLAIAIPFLPLPDNGDDTSQSPTGMRSGSDDPNSNRSRQTFPARNRAAAPPTYLLIVAAVPICTAAFISASRWFNYRHQGFDILFGSGIGIVFAWFGFRWYHLPIRRGAGWSWGARSRERAFYLGRGVSTYVGEEGWGSAKAERSRDLEHEAPVLGAGMVDHPTLSTGRGDRTEHSSCGSSKSLSR